MREASEVDLDEQATRRLAVLWPRSFSVDAGPFALEAVRIALGPPAAPARQPLS